MTMVLCVSTSFDSIGYEMVYQLRNSPEWSMTFIPHLCESLVENPTAG